MIESKMMCRALCALMLLPPAAVQAQQTTSSRPPMQCDTGPVTRAFGGTEWIVYSCDDEESLVVISAQGNPASPFVFFLRPNAESYQIVGEGNGDKRASDAAGAALAELSSAAIAALLAETKVAATPPS